MSQLGCNREKKSPPGGQGKELKAPKKENKKDGDHTVLEGVMGL